VSAGVPAALLASGLWGSADFLAGRASRRHRVLLVAFVGQAAGLVALAAILAVRGLDAAALAPGALAGVFGVAGVTALYAALGLGTMSIVAPIAATSAIVPVIAGVADGERPVALQWIGVAAALVGVVLAAREPGEGASQDSRAALRLALLAALTIGLSLVFLDRAADHDALSGVGAARAVSAPALAAALWWQARRAGAGSWRPRARPLAALAGIGLLDTAANTAFALATTGGLLSLIAVLGGLFPIVTVALAYLVLGERLAPLQRAGVVLALAGVPLISAG
jgi:drug/metabolite transporter (DMT)-like permease